MPYSQDNACQTTPANPPETEALFPGGSTPSDRTRPLSALCSYGETQLVVTGALRQFLIQHFADPRNILNPNLRKEVEREGGYKENDPTTALWIESLYKWEPGMTESRPALLIKDQAWEWQRVGISDLYREDPRTGRQTFHGFWRGAHTIFAISNDGAASRILATEVSKILLWYARRIADALEMHRFIPVRNGAVSALQESTENYVVPVDVAYDVGETWWTQEEAPRLKRIQFTASHLLAAY